MTGTKDRILAAGAELFRQGGYAGTGVKQIVEAAGAPFGSLYHFFPGGKEQLGEEVVRGSGRQYIGLFDLFLTPGTGLVEAIEAFFAAGVTTLLETDYAEGCPIATVALEVATTNETLRRATADVFTSWIDAGTERLTRFGLPPASARTLAIALITSLEGAFVLARAMRSTEPMAVAGTAVADVARRLLAEPD
ncbi:TetR/AcrR family transcriptional regulator [Amycolatopsis sp. PS_44_ISF1]|uniref:TetR/AcrR family transcriptional regulator n=1 Tax=Amycolatopsis sp. PS_44_ISF1 TaxID=2974917 RepID=UPI0028DD95EF|nr:TetR/AcrR family transcriptional regulator [Amycolatopsis sp. PS_44_ISF1]MDT8915506.1 TetR/AcrR family transcriptional regulator [Amycolatopsis sp. PS_44_ISF1]